MQEDESPDETAPEGTDQVQAHLIAAGEAVRTWAYARRAVWTNRPLASPPLSTAPESIPIAQPPVDASAEIQQPWEEEPSAFASATAHVARPRQVTTAPLPPERTPEIAADMRREPRVRWSRRLAVAAALVAIVGAAGWTARSQWLKWSAAPKNGTAFLDSVPTGSDIVVGGRPMGKTPLTIELPPGQHTVEFRRRNVAPRTLDIVVTAGESTVGRLDWAEKRTGRLQVRSNPDGATVLVDGRQRGVSPLTIEDLTVGPHTVVLTSSKGSVQRKVDVTPGNTTEITEAIYAGWLHLTSSVELEISEGTRAIRLNGENTVLLPPGSHTFRFESRTLGYSETRQVDINPGETTAISIVPQASVLTVAATLPAEVFIDDELAGQTPMSDHVINLGTREITVRSLTGIERRFTIAVGAQPTRIDVDFSKP